jgi:hypothetical protein
MKAFGLCFMNESVGTDEKDAMRSALKDIASNHSGRLGYAPNITHSPLMQFLDAVEYQDQVSMDSAEAEVVNLLASMSKGEPIITIQIT